MRAIPTVSPSGGRATLRESFDTAAHLLGLSEVRADRAITHITLQLGPPGETGLAVLDHRAAEPRRHALAIGADDLVERLMAIREGQAGLRAKILVDPTACFTRTLVLPSAVLPRMRMVLAQELEAATPFRAEGVHADWFVESEDVQARTLQVRHVVLKRGRLDPLLAALAQAGIAVATVTVGPDEARTMPVDLLSGGHRTLQGLAGGARTGDLAFLAGAVLLLLGAVWGWHAHQAATLEALDAAVTAARRAAGPALPAPLQAGTAALLAGRTAPVARTWEALAAALPATDWAVALRLDRDSAYLTLQAADEAAALEALAQIPGFGPPHLRDAQASAGGGHRLLVELPRVGRGERP
ncbi:hypothetical protein [Methylobacterium sp. Leaf118]|uniref:hypothetical protein n=1 Tax=Methylobacterium sp. Leaf118 TaxID=2876562 RepID=UPI001E60E28D|nr:hypothetical protein [Methylobacterium sp. Leaf118]